MAVGGKWGCMATNVPSRAGLFLTRKKEECIHAVVGVWKRKKKHVYTKSTQTRPQLEWEWYCNAQPLFFCEINELSYKHSTRNSY